MDIKYRMEEVNTLMCKACQDFLLLIIKENWQEKLFKTAKNELSRKASGQKNNADKYKEALEKMKDLDNISDFDVKDMDITIINAIVCYGAYSDIVPNVERSTKDALRVLTKDKNNNSHSGKNESKDELYRRSFKFLEDLRSFIQTVENDEINTIDEPARTAYRRKYISRIKTLQETLDKERIDSKQRQLEIERDINSIITSKDPVLAWVEIYTPFFLDWTKNRNDDEYISFLTKAADAGIFPAHEEAASYYYRIAKDYDLAERHLSCVFNYYVKTGEKYDPSYFLMLAEIYLNKLSTNAGDATAIINKLKNDGYTIETTADGTRYVLLTNNENSKKTIDKPQESNAQKVNSSKKNGLYIGGVSGNTKMRLGRIHKKKDNIIPEAASLWKEGLTTRSVSRNSKKRLGRIHKKNDTSKNNGLSQ